MNLLSAKQAAAYRSVSLSKVYELKDSGKVPYDPIDGCIRFAEQDLQEYLASVRVERKGEPRTAPRRDLKKLFT